MRRRFAWKEVTAKETMDDILKGIPNETAVKKAMTDLNDMIASIDGLGISYQIGAAYFKKVEEYDGKLEMLWNYHIKGLLYEYFRGERKENIATKMQELEDAFYGRTKTDNNNG